MNLSDICNMKFYSTEQKIKNVSKGLWLLLCCYYVLVQKDFLQLCYISKIHAEYVCGACVKGFASNANKHTHEAVVPTLP